MNKKALALGITLAVSLPGMASAAVNYDGGKLSSKDGPAFQPAIQSLDEVESLARTKEGVHRLQDQPDAKTEAITGKHPKNRRNARKKGRPFPANPPCP